MPIVDGLMSSKMIRELERSQEGHRLSPRASLNGQVPIIAVSASLVERERQTYVDAGFDAWIVKPVSFERLGELMAAIVDPNIRQGALYKPGEWGRGGWFDIPKLEPDTISHRPVPEINDHLASSIEGGKSRSAPQLSRREPAPDSEEPPESITTLEPMDSPDPIA